MWVYRKMIKFCYLLTYVRISCSQVVILKRTYGFRHKLWGLSPDLWITLPFLGFSNKNLIKKITFEIAIQSWSPNLDASLKGCNIWAEENHQLWNCLFIFCGGGLNSSYQHQLKTILKYDVCTSSSRKLEHIAKGQCTVKAA